MQDAILEKQALSISQQNMEAYFKTHDIKYIAEDAVFIDLSNGKETKGREAIGQMLHYIYHVAFDAKADFRNKVITEDKAMVEGFFKGRHIGEFAGMQARNKEVNVPLCVSYDLENGLIKKARIYMLTDVMMGQLNAE